MKVRIVSLVLSGLLAACASDHPSGPIPGLPFATALQACGPADGPAVEILLVATDPAGGEPQAPYARIYLTHGISEIAGKRYALGEANGAASWISAPGQTEVSSGGEIRITSASTTQGITGTVDLAFPSRGKVAGSFSANWTPRAMMCG